ncbi:MAG: flavodoxin [Treponema sp.]|nr:flavodoxin [Treponema sp.]
MNIAVRYLSRSGNTEKVARAIAEALGVEAVSIDDPGASVIEKETDILFLGAAVYAFGIDDEAAAFIQKLDKANVKHAAVFSTSALVKSAHSSIKKLLAERGIPLSDKAFHCWGEFKFTRKGRPNAADLEQAKAFAREVVLGLENKGNDPPAKGA